MRLRRADCIFGRNKRQSIHSIKFLRRREEMEPKAHQGTGFHREEKQPVVHGRRQTGAHTVPLLGLVGAW